MAEYFSTLLNRLIEWTDEEISSGKKFLDWNEVTIHWENLELHWEDVFILLELRKRGGSSAAPPLQRGEKDTLYREGNPWRKLRDDLGDEKAERVVKVICKINGIEYNSILENKEVRILVNDFIRTKGDEKITVKIKL